MGLVRMVRLVRLFWFISETNEYSIGEASVDLLPGVGFMWKKMIWPVLVRMVGLVRLGEAWGVGKIGVYDVYRTIPSLSGRQYM